MTLIKATAILIIIIVITLSLSLTASAEYSPRDFLAMAPASTFYTEDEMSEAEKSALIKNGFTPQASFSCEAWGVAEETPTSLTLKYCRDSSVRIWVYPSSSSNTVVVVESSRSSGGATDLTFFLVDYTNKKISPVRSDALATLGLEPITENDFLTDSQRFKPEEAESATLFLDEKGEIQATAQTWMNPRWKTRQEAYRVRFAWDGARFKKQITAIENR